MRPGWGSAVYRGSGGPSHPGGAVAPEPIDISPMPANPGAFRTIFRLPCGLLPDPSFFSGFRGAPRRAGRFWPWLRASGRRGPSPCRRGCGNRRWGRFFSWNSLGLGKRIRGQDSALRHLARGGSLWHFPRASGGPVSSGHAHRLFTIRDETSGAIRGRNSGRGPPPFQHAVVAQW